MKANKNNTLCCEALSEEADFVVLHIYPYISKRGNPEDRRKVVQQRCGLLKTLR